MPSTHELGQRCLAAFHQLVPAAQGAFYRIDGNLQACDFQLWHMPDAMHSAYLHQYRCFDPLQPRTCLSIGQPVVPLQLALAHHERNESRVYQRFLRQHGVVDVVEVIASARGRPLAGISLLRRAGQTPFDDADLQRLQALQGLVELAAQSLPAEAPDHLTRAGLTPREREIALLLRDGASNKHLAQHLGVGLPTVKTHLINLFRKVGVSNRTELVGTLFL